MKLIIINGPNLNLLGQRETTMYGTKSFESYFEELKFQHQQVKLDYFQSNIEGELIDKIQQTGFTYDGMIINAGGYTHSSVAIGDAIAAVSAPCIEVHISNIFAREAYRHHSFITQHCKGMITGLGLEVYALALHYFLNIKSQ